MDQFRKILIAEPKNLMLWNLGNWDESHNNCSL